MDYVFYCLLAINFYQLNQELVEREIKLLFLQKLKHLIVFFWNNKLKSLIILFVHHVQLVKDFKHLRQIFN